MEWSIETKIVEFCTWKCVDPDSDIKTQPLLSGDTLIKPSDALISDIAIDKSMITSPTNVS